MQTPAAGSAPEVRWLDAFWQTSVPSDGDAGTTAREPVPPWRIATPSPGTLFLLAMSLLMALWQRRRSVRTSAPR